MEILCSTKMVLLMSLSRVLNTLPYRNSMSANIRASRGSWQPSFTALTSGRAPVEGVLTNSRHKIQQILSVCLVSVHSLQR